MSESNKIVLTSSDGEAFEVDEAVAREFEIVAHMIEDGCVGQAIPLTNVTADILGKVIEYCKKHVEARTVGENEGASEDKKEEELKTWDEEFTKVDMETLFKLLLAANYLNTKGLLDLVCQKIADSIKEKSPDEVREIFKIVNDFTPEEEAQVRKENDWAFH